MFSKNECISFRQVYRLYVFSFVGISTLAIPGRLAGALGIYGVLSILLAGGIAYGYLIYLNWIEKKMGMDLFQYLGAVSSGARRILRVIYLSMAFCALVCASYVASVFATLVQRSLAVEENYIVILAIIMLVSGYAVVGGIESRARVYEILFWFVLISMLLLLFISLKSVNLIYYSFQRSFSISDLCKESYVCFLPFQILFFSLILPKYTRIGQKRIFKSLAGALFIAIMILLCFYLILLGTFGEKALSVMEFPAVTLFSNIQFSGGFLKRLDAIMMGIWFFTLYALMNMNVHYGSEFLKEAVQRKGKKRYLFLMLGLIFVLTLAVENYDGIRESVEAVFLYLCAPLYVVLPGVFLWLGRRSK